MGYLHKRVKGESSGQSFVELMLIALALGLMIAGVVEFGLLLNEYLKVLDGAREAARVSSSSVAFDPATGVSDQRFFVIGAMKTMSVMAPITLNGNKGDDIIISVFSVSGSNIVRWPLGYSTGWSLCANYGAILGNTTLNNIMQTGLTLDQYNAFVSTWNHCTPKPSHFDNTTITTRMDASAPPTGVLLVEVYYNYSQILKLPVLEQVIPDPILVYTYSVMPISSAEPTAAH